MVRNFIEEAFSVNAIDLMSLRATDKALDEACKDFEELSELKEEALRCGDEGTVNTAQISIEEVKAEIRQRLHALLGASTKQTH